MKRSQQWRGEIEIVYSSTGLQEVQNRLKRMIKQGLKISTKDRHNRNSNRFEKEEISHRRDISVIGPNGNTFFLREANDSQSAFFENPRNGYRKFSKGSLPLGISSITIFCAKNTSKSISKFYLDIFQFPVRYDHENTKATIFANNMAQEIHFVEKKDIDVDADNEEHMAIYIGNFESCFKRCESLGIIWINPRFTKLDASKTLEQALEAEAFRIRDIKDPNTGTKLLRLEHEIRSLRHPKCPLKQYSINKKKAKL